MKHQDLTAKIIQCAYKVHNTLGFGFLEAIYQNALLIELKKSGLHAEKEKRIQVYYDNQLVGDYIADIIVEDNVILELKSVKDLHDAHSAQLINYLKATGIEIGLLINFGDSVQVKRKVFTTAMTSIKTVSSVKSVPKNISEIVPTSPIIKKTLLQHEEELKAHLLKEKQS
jgi:GxxExxY protein